MDEDVEAFARGLRALLQAAERLEGIDELTEQVKRLVDTRKAENMPHELSPDRGYNYGEVADFLGIKRSSVRAIPRAELPRIRKATVLGVDVMAYRGEITYDEAEAYKEVRRQRVLSALQP